MSSEAETCAGCAKVRSDLSKLKAFVEMAVLDGSISDAPPDPRVEALELQCAELQQGLESMIQACWSGWLATVPTVDGAIDRLTWTAAGGTAEEFALLDTHSTGSIPKKEVSFGRLGAAATGRPALTKAEISFKSLVLRQTEQAADVLKQAEQSLCDLQTMICTAKGQSAKSLDTDATAQHKLRDLRFAALEAEAAADKERVQLQIEALNTKCKRPTGNSEHLVAEVSSFRHRITELRAASERDLRLMKERVSGVADDLAAQLIRVESLESQFTENLDSETSAGKHVTNSGTERENRPKDKGTGGVLEALEACLSEHTASDQDAVMLRMDELEKSVKQHAGEMSAQHTALLRLTGSVQRLEANSQYELD